MYIPSNTTQYNCTPNLSKRIELITLPVGVRCVSFSLHQSCDHLHPPRVVVSLYNLCHFFSDVSCGVISEAVCPSFKNAQSCGLFEIGNKVAAVFAFRSCRCPSALHVMAVQIARFITLSSFRPIEHATLEPLNSSAHSTQC